MARPELNPCPFCRGEAVLAEPEEDGEMYRVECEDCGSYVMGWWLEDAIEGWNQWAEDKRRRKG